VTTPLLVRRVLVRSIDSIYALLHELLQDILDLLWITVDCFTFRLRETTRRPSVRSEHGHDAGATGTHTELSDLNTIDNVKLYLSHFIQSNLFSQGNFLGIRACRDVTPKGRNISSCSTSNFTSIQSFSLDFSACPLKDSKIQHSIDSIDSDSSSNRSRRAHQLFSLIAESSRRKAPPLSVDALPRQTNGLGRARLFVGNVAAARVAMASHGASG